jgi:flagellar biosynthetic protein FliR
MPGGFGELEKYLLLWAVAMLRPGAAFLAAPVTGATQIPVQLRLVVSLAIGIPAIQLSGFTLPPDGLLTVSGLLMAFGEIVIGLALGFSVQLGFAAALIAGETISNAMGLGFAAMNDPMTGHPSSAVGHLLTMIATFLFLGSDGHLLFARVILESYRAFPPGGTVPLQAISGLATLGSLIFSAGLVIAMPVASAIVLLQLIMGVLGRSAPSLNLLSVGMPAAVAFGVLLLAMSAPMLAESIMTAVSQGLARAGALAHGG